MMKFSFLFTFLFSVCTVSAQTKIFREVANAVRSQFGQVTQGRQVIGYVNLVQIERATKDSFNYELAILDENLNDISTAKFRDVDLSLGGVAFDKEVLCLSFFKSTFRNTAFNSVGKYSAMLYFFDLEGKVLNTADLGKSSEALRMLTDLPDFGFAGALGKTLYAFDHSGKKIWEKELDETVYNLTASSKVLASYNYKDDKVVLMNSTNGKSTYELPFTEFRGYGASITGADVINDTIFYTGTYVKRKNGLNQARAPRFKHLKKNAQKGAFTVRAWEPSRKGTKITDAIWAEGDISDITKTTGNPENNKENYLFSGSVTDAKGDSYFYAYTVRQKLRVGSIIGTVLTIPLIYPPFIFAGSGYNKYYFENASTFRMTPKGIFTKQSDLTSDRSYKFGAKAQMAVPYTSYSLNDKEGANPFFIANTKSDIKVVNLRTKKVKEIPNKQGDIITSVYPAKEGHFLLVEKNAAEKTTKLSIVSL